MVGNYWSQLVPIVPTFDLISQDSNLSQNQDQSQFDQILPPATSSDMSISTNAPRSLPDLTERQNVSQQSQLSNMSFRSGNNGLLYSNRNPSRRTRLPRSSRSCSPSDSHPSQRARLTYAASIWILATYDIVGHLRYSRSVTTTL